MPHFLRVHSRRRQIRHQLRNGRGSHVPHRQTPHTTRLQILLLPLVQPPRVRTPRLETRTYRRPAEILRATGSTHRLPSIRRKKSMVPRQMPRPPLTRQAGIPLHPRGSPQQPHRRHHLLHPAFRPHGAWSPRSTIRARPAPPHIRIVGHRHRRLHVHMVGPAIRKRQMAPARQLHSLKPAHFPLPRHHARARRQVVPGHRMRTPARCHTPRLPIQHFRAINPRRWLLHHPRPPHQQPLGLHRQHTRAARNLHHPRPLLRIFQLLRPSLSIRRRLTQRLPPGRPRPLRLTGHHARPRHLLTRL